MRDLDPLNELAQARLAEGAIAITQATFYRSDERGDMLIRQIAKRDARAALCHDGEPCRLTGTMDIIDATNAGAGTLRPERPKNIAVGPVANLADDPDDRLRLCVSMARDRSTNQGENEV